MLAIVTVTVAVAVVVATIEGVHSVIVQTKPLELITEQ
jgi:hypothetical protein